MSLAHPHSQASISKTIWWNATTAIALAVVTNAIVFLANWDSSSQTEREPSFAPPGYVIGTIWLVLFGFMGAARGIASSTNKPTRLLTALIAICVTYPFYTQGLDSRYIALAGAIATFILSTLIAVRFWNSSQSVSKLIIPVSAWSVFATALVIRGIQLN